VLDSKKFRLLADSDVRPQAAAAVVAAGGRLYQISDMPSLEMIYSRYFENLAQTEEPGPAQMGARHAA
jgi:ABC-2 type transport system ATP-binding protein